MLTSRFGSTTPAGRRRSTASTSVKMALLAPIPSPKVSTAIAVKPGLFQSERAA